MPNPGVDALALEIARCPEIAAARDAAAHPCSAIVRLQVDPRSEPESYQVPEAWAGNLASARVVFLSSNPSISEDGTDHGAGSPERYPRANWSDSDVIDFMTRRFDPDTPYTVGDRFVCQDGTYAPGAVRFWTAIRQRATELLGYPADPASDYVMTEVVHCKSKRERGVAKAANHCGGRYLERIMSLSAAPVVVVVGAKARDRLRSALDVHPRFGSRTAAGEERANVVLRQIGGRSRVLCYLPHPTGMEKAPRDFPRAYPTLLPAMRAVAVGTDAVANFG